MKNITTGLILTEEKGLTTNIEYPMLDNNVTNYVAVNKLIKDCAVSASDYDYYTEPAKKCKTGKFITYVERRMGLHNNKIYALNH